MLVELPCDPEPRVLEGRVAAIFHPVPDSDVGGHIVTVMDRAGTPLVVLTMKREEMVALGMAVPGMPSPALPARIVTGGVDA